MTIRFNYYVNIDLGHQDRISVAESQAFLLVKRLYRQGARRNGCFCRLNIQIGVVGTVLGFVAKKAGPDCVVCELYKCCNGQARCRAIRMKGLPLQHWPHLTRRPAKGCM